MGHWWQELGGDRRKGIALACGKVLACLVVLAGCVWGMAELEKRVLGHPGRGPVAARVQLCALPDWMPAPIAEGIARSVLPEDADLNDRQLTEKAYKSLSANPWVRKVLRVEKRLTADPHVGVLEVDAEYRKPVARVPLRGARSYAYVSDDAYRLPDAVPHWVAWVPTRDGQSGKWTYFLQRNDMPPIAATGKAWEVHYMTITGVAHDAPEVGQRWEGGDIVAGLRLVGLLWDRQYVLQIAEVRVANASKPDPELTILARQKARSPETVILFGRFPNPEGDWVVPPDRKLQNLDRYVRAGKGTLAGLAQSIDLQTDPPTAKPYSSAWQISTTGSRR
ncbi:MAG TPA: hypothetical protein VM098_00620 [Phycisphaerae bacterium]|nr:hypothetical protein [Phycisphaerae bacterium]